MSLLKHLCSVAAVFTLAAVSFGQAPKPTPDVVIFQNGDQLTGTMERGVGDSIVFKSDIVGEVTIPYSKIKELRSSGSFAIIKKDTPPTRDNTQTGTIIVDGSTVTLAHPMAPVETIPVANVNYIIDQPTYDKELEKKESFWYGWTGSVTAGSSFVQSTQHGGTLTAGAALVRNIPTVPYLQQRNRTIFNLQETYGKLTTPVIPQTTPPSPDSVVKTSIFHTDAERDEYITKRFYYLGNLAFDHNFSSGLQLQQLYGGGFGWTPVLSPKQELDLKIALDYEKQQFEDPTTNENIIGASVGESYKRNMPRSIVFTESLTVLPAFNQPKAYSANGAIGIAMPVFKRFSFTASASDAFLNNPSPGFRKNTFQYVTGISYTLK